MGGCFTWLLLLAAGVFIMMTLLRWFEQTAEAVDYGWWNKVMVLVAMPFAVWFFPSKVGAGRPTAVPHHEPVRGMGAAPKARPETTQARPAAEQVSPPVPTAPVPVRPADDGPPPGTPKEFLGMPVIPPKAKKPRQAADPEKVAKLMQKMREQGMLPPEDGAG